MKKIGLFLLVIISILLSASCGESSEECKHSWSAATCTESAVCELCGIEQGEPLGHKLVKSAVHAPTCTTDGYTDYSCSACKFAATADVVPASGHTLVKGSVHAPTCTADGYTDYSCSNCDFTSRGDAVASPGHSFGEWVNNDEIKLCDKVSVLTRDCSACGATETESSIPTSHALVFHEGEPASCTENGYKDYNTCERCDYTTYEEIPAGHSYTETLLPPTCLDDGYTTHTCLYCSDSYNDSFEDATGHTMGAWYQSCDATTTHDGEMRSACLNCSYYETKGLTVVATGNFGKAATTGGTPSDSAIWTLYENGTLKISGTGATFGCGWNGANQPFKEYRDSITKLVIGEGITENSSGDFANLSGLTEVEFPTTFKKINTNAFMDSFKNGITSITIPEQVTYLGTFIFGYYATSNATFTDIIIENPNVVFYTNPSNTANELKMFNRGNHNDQITLYSYGAENNVSAYAAKIGATYVDLESEVFGTDGNLSYKFFEGVLSLGAVDATETVSLPEQAPWLELIDKREVVSLKIGEGITEIPEAYFADYTGLEAIVLSDDVTVIQDRAFSASSACEVDLTVNFSRNILTLGSELFKNRSGVTVYAFTGTPAESYTEQGVTVSLQKVFRLLLIGNSLSLDAADNSGGGTASVLYDIIKAMLGENSYVEIGTLYSGARTAAWHATMARDEVAAYKFSVISDGTDGKWSVISTAATSKFGLEYAAWDVVTVQPYGNETLTGVDDTTTGISNSYKDEEFLPLSVSLPYLLDYIGANSPRSDVYYYLTWSNSKSASINVGSSKFSDMVDVAVTASAYRGASVAFSGVIPVGTAMQNARTTYLGLLNYDDETDKQLNLQRDNVHLSLHVGRYIAALTFAEVLVPESMRAADYELPTISASPTVGPLPIGYTELAQKAVSEAVASISAADSQKYRPTAIAGYETDPSALHAEAVEAMSFAGLEAADTASLIEAIKAAAASGAPDGTVIDVAIDTAPDFTSASSSFTATVTVRYGYMQVSVAVSGTVNA